jgi:hypothetical protein
MEVCRESACKAALLSWEAVRRFALASNGMTIRERTEIAIPMRLRWGCSFSINVMQSAISLHHDFPGHLRV